MFDIPVRRVMRRRDIIKAAPETTVSSAVKRMAKRNLGAVAVVKANRVVGIFTERDAVFRVLARGLDATATHLADVMTPSPLSVDPDRPFGYALAIMHEHGFRHLPVIENGELVGIVSARSALDPDLEDFVSEARRREHFRGAGKRLSA